MDAVQGAKRKLAGGSAATPAGDQEQQREQLIAACEAALGCTLPRLDASAGPVGQPAAAAAPTAGQQQAGSPGDSGSSGSGSGGTCPRLVIFSLFALEGFHIAEALGVPCLAASPCQPPYGPPPGFEARFERAHPQLYERLREARGGWPQVQQNGYWKLENALASSSHA